LVNPKKVSILIRGAEGDQWIYSSGTSVIGTYFDMDPIEAKLCPRNNGKTVRIEERMEFDWRGSL
jgi:hypothetical protein